MYDVIIVGAGPAGLFASYELIKNNKNLKILLIDEGKFAEKRFCPMTMAIKYAKTKSPAPATDAAIITLNFKFKVLCFERVLWIVKRTIAAKYNNV